MNAPFPVEQAVKILRWELNLKRPPRPVRVLYSLDCLDHILECVLFVNCCICKFLPDSGNRIKSEGRLTWDSSAGW